jgi:hypothetical protein
MKMLQMKTEMTVLKNKYRLHRPYINELSKKRNVPFSGPFTIFIVKGLNTVSHACSKKHKQLMNMHLWTGH